ncbi:hypothetical protein F4X10_02735 [Candidatus Poribacteria bacterium]|nr:hypothetical protein [Candidatus Poribacteria bacterium]
MNSEYPHAGKHLNKPIIRDLIPLVYPGEGYFTVNEFREMIAKYHEENGGKSWIVKGIDNLIRYVLQEYVEQHGWTCQNEKILKCHPLFRPKISKVRFQVFWFRGCPEFPMAVQLIANYFRRKKE